MNNKTVTKFFLMSVILLLTSCATNVEPISVSGRNLTYEHGVGKGAVTDVYVDADKQCKKQGLTARSIASSCPFRCVTNFICE